MRCARCKLESTLERHFKTGHWGFARKGRICPLCRYEIQPQTFELGATLVLLLYLGVLAWLVSLEIDRGHRVSFPDGVGIFIKGWVLLFVLPLALAIVHELVHAVAAWLVGARVYEIRLGWGAEKRSFRLGRLRITHADWLSGGGFCIVGAAPGGRRWARLAIGGAPLALHFAAAVALGPSMVRHFGTGGHMALHVFYAYNLWVIAINAIPRDYKMGGRAVPNDAKSLIAILRRSPEAEEWEKAEGFLPAYYASVDGDYETYSRLAIEYATKHPDDEDARAIIGSAYWATDRFEEAIEFVPELAAKMTEDEEGYTAEQLEEFGSLSGAYEGVIRGQLYIEMERYDDAVREFRRGLDKETAEERRASWKTYVAYAHYLGRNPEGAVPAREAYAAMPWCGLAVAARAAWHVESGEPEKALEVMDRRTDPISKVEKSMHLIRAEALATLGKVTEARKHYEAVRRGFMPASFERRVEEALKAAE